MVSVKVQEMIELSLTMDEVENRHDQCCFCWKANCGCENKETVLDNLFLNFEDTPVENVQNKFAI